MPVRRVYEEPEELGRAAVEEVIARGDPAEVAEAVISAALYADDVEWAQDLCLRLAVHDDPGVRGNAVLGLGHLARIHGWLDRGRAEPVIAAGLCDASEYVRGQADAAASDVEVFLGWRVPGASP